MGGRDHLDDAPAPGALRRRDAVIAGHLGDEATAREAKSNDDPAIRASAYGALARMGALDDSELRDALRDPAPTVRMRAAALTTERPEVSPAPLLADPSDDVAETAAWACGEDAAADLDTMACLAELATGHPNPLVREAAVAALGAIGHPAGLDAILVATTDRAAVRRRAVLALAPFEGPEVEAALRRASADRDWQTRDAAELLMDPD
ncbi:HEAT repeat domain-containing protein [Candidatus Poriferisocius sp.]|uniref:HEAT repeat domain-containing protein n=1 Tax=Candidatus Poriferisocius sp. TaxID=3101276 RepID=UPI003B01B445